MLSSESILSTLSSHRRLDAGFALVVIVVIVSTEYFFRHYFLFWFPHIGTLRVNDMISLFLAYFILAGTLGFITAVDWNKELSAVYRAVHECITKWSYVPWIIAIVASITVLSVLDRWLLSNLTIPVLESSHRNSTIWLSVLALPLKAISLVVVNGLFVPVAEEFLWRGIVQPRFARVFALPVAIGITATLFSLKHVLVDGSFGRFLMAIGFGVICGLLSYRKGWTASAALHAVINTISSIAALATGTV